MKRIIAVLLVALMFLSATGCKRISSIDGWLNKYLQNEETSVSEVSLTTSDSDDFLSLDTLSELQSVVEETELEVVSIPDETTSSASSETVSVPKSSQPTTSSKPSSQISDLLNSADLNPQKTNAPKLDALVDSIFAQIHTSEMSTYDKVKACYDYLVNNCRYSSLGFAFLDMSVVSDLVYSSDYDEQIIINAYLILSTKEGVCDNYSSAFVVMCRRIGLDAHIVGGTVSKKGGGRTGHAWAYINLSGTQYIFDPQVQSNNTDIPYHYFGKTYAQMGSTYEADLSVYNAVDFANFKCYQKPAYDINASLDVIGGEKTVSTTAKQDGMSLTSHISGIMDGGVVTDSDGCAKIVIKPSGGSGSYTVAVTVTDNVDTSGTVIFENNVTGEQIIEINYNNYLNRQSPQFNVYIIDNCNEESYLIFKGILLKHNIT